MARIWVTGGAGFIGSHLCEALLRRGDSVLCIDNLNGFYDPSLKKSNLEAVAQTARECGGSFVHQQLDILDTEAITDSMLAFKPDCVVHLAAYAGVRPSIENPALYTRVNVQGTVSVLDAMVAGKVGRIVFASSSSVYGRNAKVPFSESDPVDHPISPYAATKKAGELICHSYHTTYGFSMACLRFFTVYGPRQRPDLAIYKFTDLMSKGRPIPFFGDGSTRRDYTYIDDILDGVLKALDFTHTPAQYQVFNLGESATTSLSEMVDAISRELGKPAIKNCLPLQVGDVPLTNADISKAREMLGYDPKFPFQEGIRRFVTWFLKTGGGRSIKRSEVSP